MNLSEVLVEEKMVMTAVLTIGNDRSANLLAQEIRNLFSKYFRNLSSKILGHESEVLARYALTFVMLSYVCF